MIKMTITLNALIQHDLENVNTEILSLFRHTKIEEKNNYPMLFKTTLPYLHINIILN